MRHFLATSNHGNHSGFNRKWTVEEINPAHGNKLIEIALNVSDNHSWVDDQYFVENPEALEDGKIPSWYEGAGVYDDGRNLEAAEQSTSYDHDLVYYLIISEDDFTRYQDDSGHYFGLYSKLCLAAGIVG